MKDPHLRKLERRTVTLARGLRHRRKMEKAIHVSKCTGLDALVINPQPLTTHRCLIKKDQFKITSTWCDLAKSEARFEFSTCLSLCLCHSSSIAWVRTCGRLSAVWWLLPCACVCLYAPTKGFALSFIQQHRKLTWRREWVVLYRNL